MKRERLEAPYNYFDAPCKRGNFANLSFYSSVVADGCVQIVADYGCAPFAFMVVRNGVFYDGHVYRNALCKLWQTVGVVEERRIFWALEKSVIAGCTALIERECPSVLSK